MSKSLQTLVTAAVASMLFVGASAVNAEEASAQRDLNNYTCKEVMRSSGTERELTLAFVHGYRLGKKGATQYDVEALSAITDKFIEHCLDNPGDKALPAFEKIAN